MNNGYKFSLSIATEPLSPAAPVIFKGNLYDIIDKSKAIGYDGIELQLRDPEKIDGDALKEYCKKTNMEISAIATGLEYTLSGLSMIDDDEQKRLKMREKLFLDVELAEKLECPVIIGCVRGNIPAFKDKQVYLERFREEMLLLSDKAAKHSVTVVLEAINFYVNNYLNSVKQTCDFIDSLNRDNIKLHIDTHHMAIEEYNMLDAVRYAGDRIGYVHFTENNRMYPGAGSVDFWSIMQQLKEIDYKGYIALEIAPLPDEDTCAIKGLEYLKKLTELVSFRPYGIPVGSSV
ncbi:MAG: sugar phosphate isomerase/epimerase [Christensenellaceae bacterium]|nr:sugar phosphate isomerase/epimerase [Christensenellaceae bacterium]